MNLYAPAIFSLDDSKSIFKYAKSAAGVNTYSLRGIAKEQYKNEPYVVALNVPIEEHTMEKVADRLVPICGSYNVGNIL